MKRAFDELTRRGRTRRLRALALQALRDWPLAVARLRLLSDGFNAFLRVDTPGGARLAAGGARPSGRRWDPDTSHAGRPKWIQWAPRPAVARRAAPRRVARQVTLR